MRFIMGVEDGEHHKPAEVGNNEHAVDTAVTGSPGLGSEGNGHAPVTVFERMAELQRRLDEAQAKLDRQRQLKNDRQQRWREANREHVNRYARELRARKRGKP